MKYSDFFSTVLYAKDGDTPPSSIEAPANNTQASRIITGHRGLVIYLTDDGFLFIRKGITARNPKGKSWMKSASNKVAEMSCSKYICYCFTTTNSLHTSGDITSLDLSAEGVDFHWTFLEDGNFKKVFVHGLTTLWKLDLDGNACQAVKILDTGMVWERRGYSDLDFNDIAVTDQLVFASSATRGLFVRTGSYIHATLCPGLS